VRKPPRSQRSYVLHPRSVVVRGLIRTGTCLALVACFVAGTVHAAAPSSSFYVADEQSFELAEFLLAGDATSDVGVASVTVAVQNQNTGQWLQVNGTWGATQARIGAALSSPGALSTRWLFRRSLPTGNYQADAAATDVNGVQQSVSSRPSRQVHVVANRPALDPGLRWLTIHFGRSNWGVAGVGECTPYDDPVNGTVFLDEAAAFMAGLGYSGQGSVPFGQFDPDPAVRKCPWRGVVSASLNDLVALRESYGWTFVADSIGPLLSNQSDRPPIANLSCPDQITTTSASLAELMRYGHNRAWGLFADPGNSATEAIRDTITSKMYAFTRLYSNNLPQMEMTQSSALAGDWARYKSVNGGNCNTPSATCYTHNITPPADRSYETPDYLFPFMIASPGNLRAIQFYRFVRGVNLPAGYPGTPQNPVGSSRESYWDCRSSNPDLHWTNREEIYCYRDFVDLLERLADEYPDVITTDAAQVARTWSVGNPNHTAQFPSCGTNGAPVASGVAIVGTPTVGQTLNGVYTYSDTEGDAEGATSFRWLRNGTSEIPGATSQSYQLAAADQGTTLRFEVRPAAQTGTTFGQAVQSAATAPVSGGGGTPGVLPATVISSGANASLRALIVDVSGGAQDLTTSWVNDGANSTAWFTVDLGATGEVDRLRVAPRGDLTYTLTVTIGNTLSGGKVGGSATGTCKIAGGSTVVPTTLKDCNVGGTGRYITVQGNKPVLRFHGLEVEGAAPDTTTVLPAAVADVGANAGTAPAIVDESGGTQNLATYWQNNGVSSTAWFTLDLADAHSITKLRVAPRGNLTYTLTVSIGNNLSGGKVSSGASGTCKIPGNDSTVPTTLKDCNVGGAGRYVTVQGNKPYLRFHGVEVLGNL
jgi:hypothetical protein